MNHEVTGVFESEAELAKFAEFVMRWLEKMRACAEEKDWALYRIEVADLARRVGVELGPFEPFPACEFEHLPRVAFKGNTVRVKLETVLEEDLDAVEEILYAVGAQTVEIAEEIDPRNLA